MSGEATVLLLTVEPVMADQVRAALRPERGFTPGALCQDLPGLVNQLERQPASAALVDIDPAPEEMLASLDPIIDRFSQTRFVVLSGQMRREWMLEAMHIGARHFMCKQDIQTELPGVLGRLIADGQARPIERGRVVTVLSAGGGSGASTLAINLANEIRLLSGQMTLLVDLDAFHGGLGLALGLKGSFGLADVLSHPGGADAGLVQSTAVDCGKDLQVLLSPASVDFASPARLALEHLPHALRACKQAYGYTVIDAPRLGMDVAATLARGSAATLIVSQLTVKDLQVSKLIRQAMVDSGVPNDQVMVVVNRYRKRRSMIDLREVRRVLGENHLQTVGNDFRSAVKALNYGRTLADLAPSSQARKDIRRLALRLMEPAPS